MKLERDIYRLNPENPYRLAPFTMSQWKMAFRSIGKTEKDFSGKIDWQAWRQSDRDFYELLLSDQRQLMAKLYDDGEVIAKIMEMTPEVARFFGHHHPVIRVQTYRASPPRAYHAFPYVELPQAEFDERLFPEHQSLIKHLASLPKGEAVVINDFPHFVYVHCPRNYDGSEGFVPSDAVKLTAEQVQAYDKYTSEMVGDGFGEGPYQTMHRLRAGVALPKDFDMDVHQYQQHIIHGEAHMETVAERWNACDKEDNEHCVPLPPFPKEWAERHGMSR